MSAPGLGNVGNKIAFFDNLAKTNQTAAAKPTSQASSGAAPDQVHLAKADSSKGVVHYTPTETPSEPSSTAINGKTCLSTAENVHNTALPTVKKPPTLSDITYTEHEHVHIQERMPDVTLSLPVRNNVQVEEHVTITLVLNPKPKASAPPQESAPSTTLSPVENKPDEEPEGMPVFKSAESSHAEAPTNPVKAALEKLPPQDKENFLTALKQAGAASSDPKVQNKSVDELLEALVDNKDLKQKLSVTFPKLVLPPQLPYGQFTSTVTKLQKSPFFGDIIAKYSANTASIIGLQNFHRSAVQPKQMKDSFNMHFQDKYSKMSPEEFVTSLHKDTMENHRIASESPEQVESMKNEVVERARDILTEHLTPENAEPFMAELNKLSAQPPFQWDKFEMLVVKGEQRVIGQQFQSLIKEGASPEEFLSFINGLNPAAPKDMEGLDRVAVDKLLNVLIVLNEFNPEDFPTIYNALMDNLEPGDLMTLLNITNTWAEKTITSSSGPLFNSTQPLRDFNDSVLTNKYIVTLNFITRFYTEQPTGNPKFLELDPETLAAFAEVKANTAEHLTNFADTAKNYLTLTNETMEHMETGNIFGKDAHGMVTIKKDGTLTAEQKEKLQTLRDNLAPLLDKANNDKAEADQFLSNFSPQEKKNMALNSISARIPVEIGVLIRNLDAVLKLPVQT